MRYPIRKLRYVDSERGSEEEIMGSVAGMQEGV